MYVVTKRFELKWNVDLIAGSRACRTHEALSWSPSFSADIEAVEATKNAEKKEVIQCSGKISMRHLYIMYVFVSTDRERRVEAVESFFFDQVGQK